jgi:hypothetical protein
MLNISALMLVVMLLGLISGSFIISSDIYRRIEEGKNISIKDQIYSCKEVKVMED